MSKPRMSFSSATPIKVTASIVEFPRGEDRITINGKFTPQAAE